MALEISGRLLKKLPEVTGVSRNGNNWIKQEFIIETQDQYPKKLCMSMWGDKVQELSPVKEGEMIKLSFNLESREYNDRWYTEIRAYKLEQMDGGSASIPEDVNLNEQTGGFDFPKLEQNGEEDDLPF